MMSRRPPNLTEPTKLQLIRAQHVHLGGPGKCSSQVLPPVLCHGLYSVSYPPTRRVLAYINLRTGAQLCVIHLPPTPACRYDTVSFSDCDPLEYITVFLMGLQCDRLREKSESRVSMVQVSTLPLEYAVRGQVRRQVGTVRCSRSIAESEIKRAVHSSHWDCPVVMEGNSPSTVCN
jgi:hypothetical protein